MATTDTTTNPDEYEGWVNRESWSVNLELANDRDLHDRVLFLVDCAKVDDVDEHLLLIARDIEAMFRDWADDVVSGTAREDVRRLIVGVGSLERVDWREVAVEWRDNWREFAS